MTTLEFQTVLLRRHLPQRNVTDPYWRRIYRFYCRQALRELRYLTQRPSKKRNVLTHYGHPNLEGGYCQ